MQQQLTYTRVFDIIADPLPAKLRRHRNHDVNQSSFEAIRTYSFHLCNALLQRGVQRGERIVMIGYGCPECAISALGSIWAGAAVVMMPSDLTAEAYIAAVGEAKPRSILVCVDGVIDRFRLIMPQLGANIPLISISNSSREGTLGSLCDMGSQNPVPDQMAATESRITTDDICLWMFEGAGFKKLSHKAVLEQLGQPATHPFFRDLNSLAQAVSASA